jgi:hypothetical protein
MDNTYIYAWLDNRALGHVLVDHLSCAYALSRDRLIPNPSPIEC